MKTTGHVTDDHQHHYHQQHLKLLFKYFVYYGSYLKKISTRTYSIVFKASLFYSRATPDMTEIETYR